MAESPSQSFIVALEPHRHRLYARARAVAGAAAEAALQTAVRKTFVASLQSGAGGTDVAAAVERELGAREPGASDATPAEAPMPADVWARLAAAVQLEAAKVAGGRALNPDSVLLSPDPLLAPKKPGPRDPLEGLDLNTTSRYVLAAVIVVVLGIALTIYIATRKGPVRPTTQPDTSTAVPSLTRP